MAANPPLRHQKRSRANDGAEKVAAFDERAKRRRTSEGNGTQNPSTSLCSLSGDNKVQDGENRKGSSPWSFSQSVGGRYSNADPIMTTDEA